MNTNDRSHDGATTGAATGAAAGAAARAIATDNPPDPAVLAYLRGAPPPRQTFTEAEFATAIIQLELAAALATSADEAGNRWVPGLSIVVVRREGGQYLARHYGHGTKHVDKVAPIGADTLFPCASLSKPVSSSLLVHAAKLQSKLKWDAPVPKPGGTTAGFYHLDHSPEKVTTLRQWLSHLSGLPDHAGDLIEDMNPEMPRRVLIDNIVKYQPGINPKEQHYTNMGFTIGCIGAAIGLGHSEWDAFALAEMKLVGMTRSTYSFVSVYHDTSDRAFPHQGQPERPELVSLAEKGWKWHVTSEADERDPRRQAPAGSLLSSAADLGTFLVAHLNKEFRLKGASPSDPDEIFPHREPTAAEGRYSLGWNVIDHMKDPEFAAAPNAASARNAISFNHSGAFRLGAGTFLRFDPDMDMAIAILSNGEPTAVPEALGQLFFKTLYGVSLPAGCDHAKLLATARSGYMEMLYAQKIKNYDAYHAKRRLPIPDRIKMGEVFKGHSDYFGCDITIERTTPTSPADDGLFLTMGNGKDGHPFWRLALHCIEDNPAASTSTFIYETKGENEVGLSPIRFVWKNNAIDQIVDDWLNEPGPHLGEINRSSQQ